MNRQQQKNRIHHNHSIQNFKSQSTQLTKYNKQIIEKLPNLLKIADSTNSIFSSYNSIKAQIKSKEQQQNNFDVFVDKDFEEIQQKQSQKYTQLWKEISKIKNTNEKQQSKQIMSKTQPILKQLENKKKKVQEIIRTNQTKMNELYRDSHQTYQILYQKREILRQQEYKRRHQIKVLKQKYKHLLTSQLYSMLNQDENYQKLIQQIDQIKSKILSINSNIQKVNTQIKSNKKELKKIYKQLITFLYEQLKYGYDYRNQGIKWIIAYLINLNINVKQQDLPDILDRKSKQYLITRPIESDTNKQDYQVRLPMLKQKSTTLSRNISEYQSVQKSNKISKIYFNTKNYLNEMIKNRSSSLNHESSNNSDVILKSNDDRKNQQIKEYQRILNQYPRQIQNKVLKIVFGISKNEIRLRV